MLEKTVQLRKQLFSLLLMWSTVAYFEPVLCYFVIQTIFWSLMIKVASSISGKRVKRRRTAGYSCGVRHGLGG